METKICKNCEIEKDIDDFYKLNSGSPQAKCARCVCDELIEKRDNKREIKRINKLNELKNDISKITNDYERADKLIELYKLGYSLEECSHLLGTTIIEIEDHLRLVGIFGIKFKKCTICKILKPIDDFHKDNGKYDGIDARCKVCKKEWDARDDVRKRKMWFTQRWHEENREYCNKYANDRYHSNITVKLSVCVSSVMYYSLKGNKNGSHWEDLVDFDLEMLIEHLESKFVEGMNWDNYGSDWEIDHIRPITSFNFVSYDDPDFKICWSLANLQPLWKYLNRIKSDKISEEFDNVF